MFTRRPVAGARDSRCLSRPAGLRHAPTLWRASLDRRMVLAVHLIFSPVDSSLCFSGDARSASAPSDEPLHPDRVCAIAASQEPSLRDHSPAASGGRPGCSLVTWFCAPQLAARQPRLTLVADLLDM